MSKDEGSAAAAVIVAVLAAIQQAKSAKTRRGTR
jgi:hypothetical protein